MPTVLVVDDNRNLRQLLSAVLARRGFDVISAGRPSQAIAAASSHPNIDLAVVDVVLPDMRCGDCVARLKEAQPKLKLVYMSGYPQEVARHRGALNDEGAFVMKPFTPEALYRTITDTLAS